MIFILNINAQKFSLNGIPYFKNFTPYVIGEKLKIVNTYDSSLSLTDFEDFSQYNVNGVVHTSIADLQNALLPVLFTRSTLGVGGGLTEEDVAEAIAPLQSDIIVVGNNLESHTGNLNNPHETDINQILAQGFEAINKALKLKYNFGDEDVLELKPDAFSMYDASGNVVLSMYKNALLAKNHFAGSTKIGFESTTSVAEVIFRNLSGTPALLSDLNKPQSLRVTSNITLTATTASQKLFGTLGSNNDGSFNVEVGRYKVEAILKFQSLGTGEFGFVTGIGDGTSAFNNIMISVSGAKKSFSSITQSNIATLNESFTSNPMISQTSSVQTGFVYYSGEFSCTTAGKLFPGFSLGVAVSAIFLAGSFYTITKID